MSRFEMDLASANFLVSGIAMLTISLLLSRKQMFKTRLLNSQYNTIKFTIEEECDQKLPFLDIQCI
jgi:hypothetical protein